MNHDRARELIVEGVLRTLAPDERETLDRHLETCEVCAAERDEYDRLWDDLGWIAAPDVSDHDRREIRSRSRARLIEVIQDVRRDPGSVAAETPRRAWESSVRRVAGIAAAAVLLIAGALWLSRDDAPPADVVVPDEPHFFLMMRMPTTGLSPAEAEEMGGALGEWVTALETEGRLVSAGRLDEPAESWIGPEDAEPSNDAAPPRRSYMVIRAADFEEARRIAATAPTLAYGGAVEVLPVR